jgi:hypothetical protein
MNHPKNGNEVGCVIGEQSAAVNHAGANGVFFDSPTECTSLLPLGVRSSCSNRLPRAIWGSVPLCQPLVSEALKGRNTLRRPYRAQMVFHFFLGRCPRLS